MVIQWTTPATEELVSAYECAAAENPAAARRITNHIWETVEVLARHPMAGRALNDRVEIKLVRKKGTKAGRQRNGGGRVKKSPGI